ncbi:MULTISPECIES: arginyltransferase [Helicobacter]|uniref:Aspartate/glutamate leucyltransferase n=1 Tax=Helicobacter colisuis TaxID=2949739 RepID=A0ABT0TTR7_9HELI|nr:MULTISPECIES: arginyltransferase [Helicobacter]MCI2236392.1 arginyltransferase [Helicobacter sp. CaF467b]MCI7047769.1 arginyltransferase [Helicobacter sp.]MCI7766153.1 arginyltransferase [Helicobacter sp.]MCL9819321.1 arginyltransferase [Helicobacter colisuis]MCL9820568.1 arginyltransferase [Helicobacter colisuis]
MEIFEIIQSSKPCSYLEGIESKFRYFYIKQCSKEFYDLLLQRGWRRFGCYFFVPICQGCEECISIRQDCENFIFSKSHQRILKNPLKLKITRPRVSFEHLELYEKYHRVMHDKKGWEYQKSTLEIYYETFVQGYQDFGYEFDYYYEEKLVGVALVDVLDNAISAVYCYYDHDFKKFSIGSYSILKQIAFAKEYNIKYLYPGYWIKDHYSMGYKEKFKPFEVLQNRPNLNEYSIWIKE